MDLDSKINDLYRLPQSEFTAARNALAKTLGGDEAKRVKSLAKPTLVPWVINQLYWKSRSVYDRLMKSGDTLRIAQIATLKGKGGDVARASAAHRKALADAVHEAGKIASADGLKPGADEVSRMLEALSLAPERAEHPGRFTELVQPAGFEALAGVGALRSLDALKTVATSKAVAPARGATDKGTSDEERVRAERAAAL